MSTSRRVTRTVAGALAITAIAAPAANALPAEMTQGSASSPPAPVLAPRIVAPPAPTVTRTIDDGFDWGSGAIGAGAAGAIVLLGGAGNSAMSRRRQRVADTR